MIGCLLKNPVEESSTTTSMYMHLQKQKKKKDSCGGGGGKSRIKPKISMILTSKKTCIASTEVELCRVQAIRLALKALFQ